MGVKHIRQNIELFKSYIGTNTIYNKSSDIEFEYLGFIEGFKHYNVKYCVYESWGVERREVKMMIRDLKQLELYAYHNKLTKVPKFEAPLVFGVQDGQLVDLKILEE